MVHEVKRTLAGRPLHMQTGRLAKQAAGSALVRFGDTVVLAAVTVSDSVSHLPFFPLTVEYREKTYAAGKFPGGFIKREGRPSEEEILAARQAERGGDSRGSADRPIHQTAVSQRVQERDAGVRVCAVGRSGKRRRHCRAHCRLPRAERVLRAVERPGSGGTHGSRR